MFVASSRRVFVVLAVCTVFAALILPAVAAGAGVVSADAGDSFSLAVLSDGTLWGWGYNSQGQLGDGTLDTHLAPSRVDSGTAWSYVSAGRRHSLALKNDGTLWAWGYNKEGQLGIGHEDDTFTPDHWHNTPARIGTASGWLQVAAGYDHSVALDADGSIWAWGENDFGQLGIGSTADATAPVLVSVSPGNGLFWRRVWADTGVTLAVASNGVLWHWGAGVAEPTPYAFSGTVLGNQAPSDQSWWTVAPSGGYVAAVTSNSELWYWQSEADLRDLGPELSDVAEAPGRVYSYGYAEVALALGVDHALSIVTSEAYTHEPLRLQTLGPWYRLLIGNDVDWTRLTAGRTHFLISKTDGSLWGWGKNTWGQLGDGTENDDLTTGSTGKPVRVILPTPIPDVANMTESDARDRIITSGFKVGTVSYVPTTGVEITRIISQTPASDTLVMPGWPVNIVVSAGPPIPVPNVVGLQETDARDVLGTTGLGVPRVTYAYSSSVPTGAVVSQDPAPDTLVAPAYRVSLTVSQGPKRKTVPYTSGATEATARSRLQAAGFVVGSVSREYSTYAAGFVCRSDPSAGTLAQEGGTVNLFVSLGKPKPRVSNPIAPSRMSRTKYYFVYGTLKPQHKAGTYPVRIYRWRKSASGSWKSYGYVNAKASDLSSDTRYWQSIRLKYAGKWRLRAYAPADSDHVAAWSGGYDYVTVK